MKTDDLTAEDLIEAQKLCQTEFYTQRKVYDYYSGLFQNGNHSLYFYRPLNFAWKQKYGRDVPFWKYLNQSQMVNPTGICAKSEI